MLLAGDALGLTDEAIAPPPAEDFFDQAAVELDDLFDPTSVESATGIGAAWGLWTMRYYLEVSTFLHPDSGVGTRLVGRDFQDYNLSVLRAAHWAHHSFADWVIHETGSPSPTWSDVFASRDIARACAAAFAAR